MIACKTGKENVVVQENNIPDCILGVEAENLQLI
jgi:hypothetical protein